MKPENTKFVIGMPSVKREPDYLLQSVDSLVSNMSPGERQKSRIVIFNAELPPENHLQVNGLVRHHQALIESGFITILTNPSGYPKLEQMSPLPSDGAIIKQRWLAKQVLDCAFLMDYCKDLGVYYLHLEDDVVAAKGFLTKLNNWLEAYFSNQNDWTILSFYNSHKFRDKAQYAEYQLNRDYFGLIGQLFRCRDLPRIAAYLVAHFDQAPIDSLIARDTRERDGKVYAHSPSLFQHVGVISSLEGRIQIWDAPEFQESRLSRMGRNAGNLKRVLIHQPKAIFAYLKFKLSLWAIRSFR